MASEGNRVVVGDTVINLDHVLYVTRDGRGVTIYFDAPVVGNRGRMGQALGVHKLYELRLQGKVGQQFWQYYLAGASKVEAVQVPMLGAHTG